MTTTPVKTLAFCGSLRKASYNRMLLKTAIGLAPEGMVVELAEIDGRRRSSGSATRLRRPRRCSSPRRNTTTRCRRR